MIEKRNPFQWVAFVAIVVSGLVVWGQFAIRFFAPEHNALIDFKFDSLFDIVPKMLISAATGFLLLVIVGCIIKALK